VLDDEMETLTAPFLASDLAMEVASVYHEHTGVGVGAGEATAAVISTFRELLADPDEGPVIFLALAATQLREGRLVEPVRDAAIALIESGDAQRAWRQTDATISIQRRTALAAVEEQLRVAELVE